jgi:hypothetical protein
MPLKVTCSLLQPVHCEEVHADVGPVVEQLPMCAPGRCHSCIKLAVFYHGQAVTPPAYNGNVSVCRADKTTNNQEVKVSALLHHMQCSGCNSAPT